MRSLSLALCGMQETMAAVVLFQFPCELLSAVVAGRWSAAGSPFIPWEMGYILRLLAGMLMTTIVLAFPAGAADFSDHPPAFLGVLAAGLLTSFSSTLMFTSMGTFFNRISDPAMGGAYLTMLNTIMNVGMTLPQGIMFFLVDTLSYNECECVAPCCLCNAALSSVCLFDLLLPPLFPVNTLRVPLVVRWPGLRGPCMSIQLQCMSVDACEREVAVSAGAIHSVRTPALS